MPGYATHLLQGQVGIVTGAGSPIGIGRSLVLELAAAGATAIYAADLTLNNIPSLQDAVKKSGSSCKVHGVFLDVASEKKTIAVLKEILATYGRVDFYFANAGFGRNTPLSETDATYFDKAYAVMQRSFFLAIRYGGQAMTVTSKEKPRPGGTITVTSSMAGTQGGISEISYSSVKAAVNGMVKPAAALLSPSMIRVNAIAPGFIRTSIGATSYVADDKPYEVGPNEEEATSAMDPFWSAQSKQSQYYHNRIMHPVEMANIGVFLASDLASAVNGQVIVADSGKTSAPFGESILGPLEALRPLV
ncbi:Enoyl-(Acyl carrier protein) reductase-like protein 26 [Elsinoe fawcettii]|nr:Enoyl-(Acyl carrier protein) reductase-like protein 26 [Elsinoe fawcettii]